MEDMILVNSVYASLSPFLVVEAGTFTKEKLSAFQADKRRAENSSYIC